MDKLNFMTASIKDLLQIIQDKYYNSDSDNPFIPLYSNIEDFIERNCQYVHIEIFSKLEQIKYDYNSIISFLLKKQLDELEYHIKENEKQKSLKLLDETTYNCVQQTYTDRKETLQKQIEKISFSAEMKKKQELTLSLLEPRIQDFEHIDKALQQELLNYKNYLINNFENIFKLSLLWNAFVVYDIEETLETNIEEVEKIYAAKNIDIATEDKEFRYGLISCKKIKSNPPQIFDSRINSVCLVKNIPNEIMEIFENNLQYINRIAFQINTHAIYENIQPIDYSIEAFQTGYPFKLQTFMNIKLTKLCDDSYENLLWITVNKKKNSLTFEEILSDNEIEFEGENVITQVVHMVYFIQDNIFFVSHIDHEYILYSIEKFEEKKKQTEDIRGRKIKTFKIDDSKIPLIYGDKNILLEILEIYFRKKDLLEEYFGKLY